MRDIYVWEGLTLLYCFRGIK